MKCFASGGFYIGPVTLATFQRCKYSKTTSWLIVLKFENSGEWLTLGVPEAPCPTPLYEPLYVIVFVKMEGWIIIIIVYICCTCIWLHFGSSMYVHVHVSVFHTLITVHTCTCNHHYVITCTCIFITHFMSTLDFFHAFLLH